MHQTAKQFILTASLIFAFGLTASADTWNVRTYGAKGDGKTPDTQAIQTAIDQCHEAGGGKVVLNNGRFLSGTIQLKSNVTLYIESGAVLVASSRAEDFPVIQTDYPTVSGEFETDKSFIYAEDAENIMIAGEGTIDGSGDLLHHTEKPRPHILMIRSCRNVKVHDIRLHNAAFWVQKYQSCDNLLIDGITVDSRENIDIEQPRFIDVPGGRNTDGCNIVDSKNVRISNCNINSGDDGIVFKSFLRDSGCSNITVSNCVITTNASGIKIGTESAGLFRDFTINNCVIYDTRVSAIGLMTVDGARIERILLSDITMRNIKGTAIFLRIGDRGRMYQQASGKPAPGTMKDILIQNIYGTDIERYGCSITGIPGAYPENIVLDNICLRFTQTDSPLYFQGYKDRPVAEPASIYDVPENVADYPRGEMFGKLPAYGFYVRHVKNIDFNNIKLEPNRHDRRPALVADDVDELYINRLDAPAAAEVPAQIYIRDTRNTCIYQTTTTSATDAFLHVSGEKTENIVLKDNDFNSVKQTCVFDKKETKKRVRVVME